MRACAHASGARRGSGLARADRWLRDRIGRRGVLLHPASPLRLHATLRVRQLELPLPPSTGVGPRARCRHGSRLKHPGLRNAPDRVRSSGHRCGKRSGVHHEPSAEFPVLHSHGPLTPRLCRSVGGGSVLNDGRRATLLRRSPVGDSLGESGASRHHGLVGTTQADALSVLHRRGMRRRHDRGYDVR